MSTPRNCVKITLDCYSNFQRVPSGHMTFKNVAITSMQRSDVASTLVRRCINAMCPLAALVFQPVRTWYQHSAVYSNRGKYTAVISSFSFIFTLWRIYICEFTTAVSSSFICVVNIHLYTPVHLYVPLSATYSNCDKYTTVVHHSAIYPKCDK